MDAYWGLHTSKTQTLVYNSIPWMKKAIGEKQGLNEISSEFLPDSYLLPKDAKLFESIQKHSPDMLFIVKALNSWSGRGVSIHKAQDIVISSDIVVVQQYIASPMLYQDQYKFDIRFWVLRTSNQAYYYPDAYLRIARKPYTRESLTDKCVHVTNGEVQKKCGSVVKGSVWLLDMENGSILLDQCRRAAADVLEVSMVI